jgi:hypothetical protein
MDIAALTAAVVRLPPTSGRGERIAFTLRTLGPLLDRGLRLGQFGAELARAVANAGAAERAVLILPPGPGPLRIEFGGRQFVVPAQVRATLLAAIAAQPTAAAARAPAAAPAQVPVAADAAMAGVLAASGAVRTPRRAPERATSETAALAFDEPLLDPQAAGATAQRIARRVEASGAFFEAHLAQWAHGERSTAAVRAEAQQLQRTFGSGEAATETRAAIAVDVLQRQTLVLAGPAWAGQDVRLQVGREPDDARAGAGSGPVFRAQLKFELPRLGRVEVDLRLAGVAVAAAFAADANAQAQLDAALPEFASALEAHGLQPVALAARAAQASA